MHGSASDRTTQQNRWTRGKRDTEKDRGGGEVLCSGGCCVTLWLGGWKEVTSQSFDCKRQINQTVGSVTFCPDEEKWTSSKPQNCRSTQNIQSHDHKWINCGLLYYIWSLYFKQPVGNLSTLLPPRLLFKMSLSFYSISTGERRTSWFHRSLFATAGVFIPGETCQRLTGPYLKSLNENKKETLTAIISQQTFARSLHLFFWPSSFI